jgi:hypothetical protein
MQVESRRKSPVEYFAMKQRIIRHARVAQAAAIRAALTSLFVTLIRLAKRPFLPAPKPEHGE